MSWWVGSPAEVDVVHEQALALGIEVTWPPTDEPWGVRECHIVHPDGHTFRGCTSRLHGALRSMLKSTLSSGELSWTTSRRLWARARLLAASSRRLIIVFKGVRSTLEGGLLYAQRGS